MSYDIISNNTALKMVLLHANTNCNLNCSYCYQGTKRADFMAVDTAVKAAGLLVRDGQKRPILLIHGGEPLLNGLGWFNSLLCRLHEKYGKDSINIVIQTNGTLITPELAEWCAKHNIRVGVSIDGPSHINELTRGSSEKTIHGITLLRTAGVYFGILCVLTKQNYADVPFLLDYFWQLRASSVRFNPVYSTPANDAAHHLISGVEYGEAMQAAYNWLKEHPEAQLAIANLFEVFRDQIKSLNICNPCHAGRSIVSVVPNGDIFPCGRYAGRDEYKIGTLSDSSYGCERPTSCDIRNSSSGCPAMKDNMKDNFDSWISDYTKAMLPIKRQLNDLVSRYQLNDSYGWSDYSDAPHW